jgi:hypothetical protein
MNNGNMLPDNFWFTQNSLSVFEYCPLKFKKRYIDNISPIFMPDGDSMEKIELGRDFHILAKRYFMGIDTCIEDLGGSGILAKWLDNLINSFPITPDIRYLPEYKLRTVSGNMMLEANFDLLVVSKESVEIWDWKTGESKCEGEKTRNSIRLSQSIQTKVYMYMLKEQIQFIAGKNTEETKIAMHYWQPRSAAIVASIEYNTEMHNNFRKSLSLIIDKIYNYDYYLFDRTQYIKKCRYCEYKWACEKQNFNV